MSSHLIATQPLGFTIGGWVLQHLIKGDVDVVFEAIRDAVQRSTSDDISDLFHYLLQACAHVKQPSAAAWCLGAMMELGLWPDTDMYNIAIGTCSRVGDLDLATKLWKQMVANRIEPNAISYNTMINACSQAGDGPQAEDWIEHMSLAGFPPCIVSFSSVIVAFAKADEYAKAEEWYEKASAAGVGADRIIYNSLMNACARCGYPERAKFWFTKMLASGFVPDETAYNSLIAASAKAGDVETAESLMKEMVFSDKTLSTITFESVLDACAKACDVDRAEYWIDVMMDLQLTLNTMCFNSVLHACAQRGEYAGALKWFWMMLSYGIQPDRISYNSIIGAYSRVGELACAEAWLNRMVMAGFHVDRSCYISLYRAFCQLDADKVVDPDLQTHYLIIKAYARAKNLDFIRSHLGQEIASTRKAQRLDQLFHEDLERICLASGGMHFVSAVFQLLDGPIDACPANNGGNEALRQFIGNPLLSPPDSFRLRTQAKVRNDNFPPCDVETKSTYSVQEIVEGSTIDSLSFFERYSARAEDSIAQPIVPWEPVESVAMTSTSTSTMVPCYQIDAVAQTFATPHSAHRPCTSAYNSL